MSNYDCKWCAIHSPPLMLVTKVEHYLWTYFPLIRLQLRLSCSHCWAKPSQFCQSVHRGGMDNCTYNDQNPSFTARNEILFLISALTILLPFLDRMVVKQKKRNTYKKRVLVFSKTRYIVFTGNISVWKPYSDSLLFLVLSGDYIQLLPNNIQLTVFALGLYLVLINIV